MPESPGEWDLIEEAARDVVRSRQTEQPAPTSDGPAATVPRSESRGQRERGRSEDGVIEIVGAEVLRSAGEA